MRVYDFFFREKILLRCYKSISTCLNEVFRLLGLDVNNDGVVLMGSSNYDSEDSSDSPSFDEKLYNQQEAKEILNCLSIAANGNYSR